MTLLHHLFSLLSRFRYLTLTVWLATIAIGIWAAPNLPSATVSAFSPPSSTRAYRAQQAYRHAFTLRGNSQDLFFLVQSRHNQSLTAPASPAYNSTRAFSTLVHSKLDRDARNVYEIEDFFTYASAPGLRLVADAFNADHDRATLIRVTYHSLNRTDEALVARMRDLADHANRAHITVGVTGLDALFVDVRKGSERDMLMMDVIVLPLALLVLAVYVRSVRLMVLPLLSVLTSLLLSFSVMWPLARDVWEVASFTPSIMMSLIIAIGIDANLFQLSRYSEEIHRGAEPTEAVKIMLTTAGRVVATSAGTLAVTFLTLVAFPLEFLRTVGIGAALSLFSTVLVNLTLTPVLLLVFPKFFSNFSYPSWCRWCRRRSAPPPASDDDADFNVIAPTNDDEPRCSYCFQGLTQPERLALKHKYPGCCIRIAAVSAQTWPALLITLLVLAATVPVALYIVDLDTTIDTTQLYPRNSPALKVFNRLADLYSPGIVQPFQILFQGQGTLPTVLNDDLFHLQQSLAEDLVAQHLSEPERMTSISDVLGVPLEAHSAKQFFNTSAPGYNDTVAELYRWMYDKQTSKDQSSTLITVAVGFDPLGHRSERWIRDVRRVVDKYNPTTSDYKIYLTGVAVGAVDAVDEIYGLFPTVIGVTCAIVFTFMPILLRSIMAPVRLLVTSFLTICWVFGLGVIVFQGSWLDSTFPALKDVHALFWLTPILSFSLLIGIASDYNVFLFSRIVEFRKLGFTNRAAILTGVHHTGSIITGAGAIMAIAFSGLLLSHEMILNQFGLLLTAGVLLDTFVIRTVLEPALIHLNGNWAWWPTKVPRPTRDLAGKVSQGERQPLLL